MSSSCYPHLNPSRQREGRAHSAAKIELQLRGNAQRVGQPRVHRRGISRRQLPPPGAARRVQVSLNNQEKTCILLNFAVSPLVDTRHSVRMRGCVPRSCWCI